MEWGKEIKITAELSPKNAVLGVSSNDLLGFVMGWSIGFDGKWHRDIGYGVPAICDHPDCNEEIDRGLSFVCGGEPYGGKDGCGLFFCYKHLHLHSHGRYKARCERCISGEDPFVPKPDVSEWNTHKKTHESWEQWRKENPELAESL